MDHRDKRYHHTRTLRMFLYSQRYEHICSSRLAGKIFKNQTDIYNNTKGKQIFK